jgi:LysM repeat protein
VASKVVSASSRRRRSAADEIDSREEPSYRVELGDTVSEIAIRHGLPTAHVLAQNGLSWKTPIFPGQVIRLEPIPDDLEWPEVAAIDERDGRAS